MYDVAIIGGHRVILFEREKFPRFHIGESLLPFGMNGIYAPRATGKIFECRVFKKIRRRNHGRMLRHWNEVLL